MSNAGLPVHVYWFAATGGNWNVANHADEAPVVTHDMDFLRSLGPPGKSKGLRKVADGMNAAWGRFVAGEKVTVETNGKDGGDKIEWPLFGTPFSGDDHDHDLGHGQGGGGGGKAKWASFGKQSRSEDDEKVPEGTGRMIVFGEGNNERAGGSSPGTPAKEEVMNEILLKACRFWWDRIELSEGLGKSREKLGRFYSGEGKGAKAKL